MSASVAIRTPGAIRLGAGLAVALGVALLTAACSSSGSGSSSAPASAATPAGGSTGSAAAAAGSGLVITTKSGSAGAFLTDGSGRAVYLWTKDGKDSSACSGACAGAWPPVTTTGAVTLSGASPAVPVSSAVGGGGY